VAAIARKAGGRSDDTGRRQYHRKKPPHDRIPFRPVRLGLPAWTGRNTCPRRRQDAVTGLCTGHGHRAGGRSIRKWRQERAPSFIASSCWPRRLWRSPPPPRGSLQSGRTREGSVLRNSGTIQP
jgi:hypothetical protein